MRALSKQQQVALALVYMVKGREYKQGADAGFALACASTALQYDSLNLNAMLLKAEAMEAALLAGGESIDALRGTAQYKEYEQWLGHIYSLGYREMPLQMKNLLVQGWTRDTITKLAGVQYTQTEKAAENTGGDTRYGSSSWGLFNEDIRTQTTERIGRSIYNTTTNTIEGFATDEQLYNHYNFDPVVFAWNVDPEVRPGINPYTVFSNNPILRIDPLGNIDGEYEKNTSGKFEKVSTKGDEIGVDFYHMDGKTRDGKTNQITLIVDEQGNTNTIRNGRDALKGESRSKEIGWMDVFTEWWTGKGPERSIFEGGHPTIDAIQDHYNYQLNVENFLSSSEKKMAKTVNWQLYEVLGRGSSNKQAQMMGTYNLSFYKLGNRTLAIAQDSKSKTSFFYHLPVKNTVRSESNYRSIGTNFFPWLDCTASPPDNRRANTYQTYIYFNED